MRAGFMLMPDSGASKVMYIATRVAGEQTRVAIERWPVGHDQHHQHQPEGDQQLGRERDPPPPVARQGHGIVDARHRRPASRLSSMRGQQHAERAADELRQRCRTLRPSLRSCPAART